MLWRPARPLLPSRVVENEPYLFGVGTGIPAICTRQSRGGFGW